MKRFGMKRQSEAARQSEHQNLKSRMRILIPIYAVLTCAALIAGFFALSWLGFAAHAIQHDTSLSDYPLFDLVQILRFIPMGVLIILGGIAAIIFVILVVVFARENEPDHFRHLR